MLKNEPLFSIAIPTYNRLNYLKKSLKSAINQTYTNKEIVVLDNASDDGTREWLIEQQQFYPTTIKVIRNPQNIGQIKNIKNIPGHIAGKYLVVLSDDDLLEPTFCERSVAALEKYNNVAIWCCQAKSVDQHGNTIPMFKESFSGVFSYSNMLNLCLTDRFALCWCGTVYRVGFLKAHGGFIGNGCTIDVITTIINALSGDVYIEQLELAQYRTWSLNSMQQLSVKEFFLYLIEFKNTVASLCDSQIIISKFNGYAIRNVARILRPLNLIDLVRLVTLSNKYFGKKQTIKLVFKNFVFILVRFLLSQSIRMRIKKGLFKCSSFLKHNPECEYGN